MYYKYFGLLIIVFFVSCTKLFDYSPYDAPVFEDNEKNINSKNIEKIQNLKMHSDADSFCFAIISDTHIEYSYLEKVVNQINKDKSIQFVIHLGDMSDLGLYNEFHWTEQLMSKLNVPHIMIIGNHDYRSNGGLIFRQMYGQTSFSFEFYKTKFVCLDDIIWENNNSYPDFKLLANQLADSQSYNHIFVLAHIPPVRDQFDDYCISKYNEIMKAYNIELSIHGHIHSYYYGNIFADSDTKYLIVDDITKHNFCKIYVSDSSFNIKKIRF